MTFRYAYCFLLFSFRRARLCVSVLQHERILRVGEGAGTGPSPVFVRSQKNRLCFGVRRFFGNLSQYICRTALFFTFMFGFLC